MFSSSPSANITLFGFFLIFALIPCIKDIDGSRRLDSWSLYNSKSFISFLATPLFIAASATAEGITLINLGSKVEGMIYFFPYRGRSPP